MRILMIGATLAGTGMIVAILLSSLAGAEEVCVKYHQCLDIDQFKCETITRSSFINRVCYLEAKRYMIIKLKDTYYHHCSVKSETMMEFLAAPSMGSYYNKNIRSKPDGTHGPFDCRDHPIPTL
jgi:KTSC domain